MMFPYPSAEGLHIGSIFTFVVLTSMVVSSVCRVTMCLSQLVLMDLGFILKPCTQDRLTSNWTCETHRRKFLPSASYNCIGYAWKNKVETYYPSYYKWTQWLFIELFKAGLAYKKKSPVNFAHHVNSSADEQVIDGKCERCGSFVERKNWTNGFSRLPPSQIVYWQI